MKIFYLLLFFTISQLNYAQDANKLTQASTFMQSTQIAFEENKGQVWDIEGKVASYVQYSYQKEGTTIFMLPTGIAYQFNKTHYPKGYKQDKQYLSSEEQKEQEELRAQVRLETYRMNMELVGANPNAKIVAKGKSADYVNYYNRNTLDVHSFNQLTYKDIYPGIDWVIYTTEKGLKYDFMVAPGADPSQIQLKFKDYESLEINKNGSFTLSNSMGSITEQAPISFQGKKDVHTNFVLEEDIIRFDIGEYDSKKLLTIDPNLIWATYYGGTDLDRIVSCAIDANGNTFVTGITRSSNNIASSGHQNTYGGGSEDAFLAKFNSNGIRQWGTYYGGVGSESARACAVDGNGNVFMTGITSSTTDIALGGHQNTYGGGQDVFLVKFNGNGIRQWGTYYGGSSSDGGYSCTTDANGNVFIAGNVSSTTGIASGGHQNTYGGGSDVFLAKFNSNGVRQWGTYYGGTDTELWPGCGTDINGNVFLTAFTKSTTNIALGGHQNTYGGGEDGFLVKFNSNGVRQWGTYYGGANDDRGNACIADANGNVYLIGSTASTTDIASGGHQNTFGGNEDGILVKFNSNGVRQWGTYYGGSSLDAGLGSAIGANGNIFLVGFTFSTNNIASGGYQNTSGGGSDAFLVEFNTNGVREWSTYYGGSANDVANDCAVDANGFVYIAGYSSSTSNIALGGHQNTYGTGFADGFLAKLTSSNIIACATTTHTITSTTCGTFDYNGQTYTSSGTYTDTLVNVGGCDSIVTLNLTIGNATYNVSGITYTPLNVTTGALVTLGDDALSINLPIGFNFNFFGNVYSDFRISSNGFITFGTATTSSGCCSGQEIPNTSQPNNLVALFWEDLRPPNGGSIRYLTTGTAPNRVLIVAFDNIEHYPSGDSVQGQIHIYEGANTIEVHVARQTATGSHTIGIENSNGTLGYAAPNRNGIAWTLSTPEAWRFSPVVSGIDVQTACNSYTWIDGNTYTVSNNTATHIIEGGSSLGCDSTVQLNLVIYDTPSSNGELTEDMEAGALIPLTGYSRELSNAQFYNPDNISAADFSALEGSLYGYGQVGGFVNSDRSIRFRTYNVPAGNEMGIVMKKVNLQCNAQVNFSYAHQNYPGNVDTMQVEVSTDCGVTWTTVWIKSGANLATSGSNTSNFLPPFTATDWAQDSADLSAYSNMSDVIVKFTVLSGYGNNIYLDDINIHSSLGYATRNIMACNSYTFNGQVYMNTGTYVDTITTTGTCDSVITLNLTINNSNTGTDVQTSCDSYTWIDGNVYTASNTTATHTLTNAVGCDSVVTLNLTINNSTSSTDVQASCDSYTWIDGNVYTASNTTATHTLTNAAGCDSVVTLNLTINTVDTTVSQNGLTLTANQIGGMYQWIDCNAGNTAIAGETAQSFTPVGNGDYAVIVTVNNCTDTSDCFNIVVNSIPVTNTEMDVRVYPNPTVGQVTIEFEEVIEIGTARLIDVNGRLLLQRTLDNKQVIQLNINELPTAVYFLELQTSKGTYNRKVIKE